MKELKLLRTMKSDSIGNITVKKVQWFTSALVGLKPQAAHENSLSFYQISQLFYNICLGLNYSKLSI